LREIDAILDDLGRLLGKLGIEADGLTKVGNRVAEAAVLPEAHAEVEVGAGQLAAVFGTVGIVVREPVRQPKLLLQAVLRFLAGAALDEQEREAVVGLGQTLAKLGRCGRAGDERLLKWDGLAIGLFGLAESAELSQEQAEGVIEHGDIAAVIGIVG